MRLTLTTETGDQLKVVEVDGSNTVEDLQALAEVEMGVPAASQVLSHNGVALSDAKKTQPVGDQIEHMRQTILADPNLLRRIQSQSPELARSTSDAAEFRRVYMQLEGQRREAEERAREDQMRLANADPFDVEAQRRIEEEIRRENINQNWELAMEHNPESFGRVTMLYINLQVNGHPIKSFVDSGAQATIMSLGTFCPFITTFAKCDGHVTDCARACNIMHLVDHRFSGIAEGVGTAKILGRVHSTQIKIGTQYLPCSFTIMEGNSVDLLFGLDMLKRHQACIDLEKNVLRIHGEELPFLSEHELPEKAREKEARVVSSDDAAAAAGSSSSVVPTAGAPPPPAAASAKSAAPAPMQGAAGGAGGGGAAVPAGFPEEQIKGLMDLGVSREEAVAMLAQCGGNADLAASLLFGG
ncbi:DNA damage-inducible protein 1 [Irineochytrium annulatum]|nr:DNA damage-inducible protein 1 [Irineochytrium annulatum]